MKIEAKLSGNLSADLDRFVTRIKDEVVLSGVAAAARVIYEEAKLNTSGARGKPGIVTGNLHRSIYRKFVKERSTGAIKVYRISWDRRIAPHGHLIEFGTVRSPAYPFMRPAYDAKISEAISAGLARMREKMKESDGEL